MSFVRPASTPRCTTVHGLAWLTIAWLLAAAALAGAQPPAPAADAEFKQLRQDSEAALNRLDFDEARAAHQRMRILAQLHERPLWLAQALHDEGIAARRLGLNEEALKRFDDALALRRRHADKAGEIESLNAYSTLQRRAGNRQAIPDAREFEQMVGDRSEHCGVILIDLDHFKRVNDLHGHLVGDQVLQATASTLRISLPAQMQLVRWGGEEFLAFGTFADADAAVAIAENLRRALRAHPPQPNIGVSISVSVGVCVADGPIGDWEPLIASADIALYQAKDGGRNRVCVAAGRAA